MEFVCTMTGAQAITLRVVSAPSVRIEFRRGRKCGNVEWHVRHPTPSLFWFGTEFKRLTGRLDGAPVECPLGANADLCVIPPDVEVQGRFDVGSVVEYTAIFFEPPMLDDVPAVTIARAKLGFGHPWLRHSLSELYAETHAQDGLSALIAEGWVLQALAHIARASRSPAASGTIVRGGLALWQERRAKEMLAASLDGGVSVSDLAIECGVSVAHFARAFRRSTGVPPHRWLVERRIEIAKDLLQNSTESIAELALACGFADQSHLTHVFRRQVGVSPGNWRRLRTR